ncbi:MAG TPA: isoprenoid biosynthesis glyoxalase ElbB [Bacteroidales bacterium]|nr:isoprenoid biosynthesis glyoxalase ElbB [Bacteroidales bacterium]HPS61823.1 isoprenoid biosynthesis glyoxalase ElbB [Bacteroidales bacterium]
MKRFAVVLAGCGVYDGAEIHEAVLTLLAIDRAGALYQCFAPDIMQHHVIDHLTGQEACEQRNVLTESARIARGKINPLSQFSPDDFDGLLFPGGFGAAKNLCDWAFKGDHCKVNPDVEKAVRSMSEAGKPIGAMCISPVILGKLFRGTTLTTGNDPASQGFIEQHGNRYVATRHGDVVADPARKLFTTPCYMLDATISQVAEGAENIVREMIAAMGA